MSKVFYIGISGWLLICWLSIGACKAQPAQSVEQAVKPLTLPLTAQWITSDKIGQLYLTDQRNELFKYSSSGQMLFRYSNNRLGNLAITDVTDPFNLLLYYPEFQQVITLDRTLNPTGNFNLFDLGFNDVPAIGMSNDNNIWLYDKTNYQLKKINRQGEELVQSNNLTMMLNDVMDPNFILERNNLVFVNVPDLGVLVFDNFAKYLSRLDLPGLPYFEWRDHQLLYLKEGVPYLYDLRTLRQKQVNLPTDATGLRQLSWQKDRLYLAFPDQVLIYKKEK